MNIERLQQVVRVLKELPDDHHFDLENWIDRSGSSGIRGDECGTVCCAVGWAMQDIWFVNEGLFEDFTEPSYYDGKTYHEGFDAVEVFFDLSMEMAFHLFKKAPRYKTSKQVINRINKAIRRENG